MRSKVTPARQSMLCLYRRKSLGPFAHAPAMPHSRVLTHSGSQVDVHEIQSKVTPDPTGSHSGPHVDALGMQAKVTRGLSLMHSQCLSFNSGPHVDAVESQSRCPSDGGGGHSGPRVTSNCTVRDAMRSPCCRKSLGPRDNLLAMRC